MQEPLHTHAHGHVAQHVGAEAVGAHERIAVLDAAVDVGLGGEVHHRVVAIHGRLHHVLIADVAVHEPAPSVIDEVADGGEVARIRESVEDGDLVVAVGKQPPHIVRADETGRAGDEQLHVQVLICQ